MKIRGSILVFVVVLNGCSTLLSEHAPTVEQVLQERGIDTAAEYGELPVCSQVELYAEVGAQFLDIDHGYALVPEWMDHALETAPKPEVGRCITRAGASYLGELIGVNDSADNQRAYRIHALIYKAADLRLFDDTEVHAFVLNAMCDKRVDYRGRIAIMYYAQTQPDLLHFPDPNAILETYCG